MKTTHSNTVKIVEFSDLSSPVPSLASNLSSSNICNPLEELGTGEIVALDAGNEDVNSMLVVKGK